MKNLWLIALASILILISSASAHMEGSSVEAMMDSMMAGQNVSDMPQLNCNKIPKGEIEELGDAVMERMVGNEQLHEQMDTMMGGKGSASLSQMHIIMGKNWLGCSEFQGMMGTNMMPMMMRMMGNYYPAYYTTYNNTLAFAAVGWVLFIVSIGLIILVFNGQIRIRKR